VRAGDDDTIHMPNYSQKKLINKLKVMGEAMGGEYADPQGRDAGKKYINTPKGPPLVKARAQEIGQNIHMVISQLNAVQLQIKKDIDEFHKYQKEIYSLEKEQSPRNTENVEDAGPEHGSTYRSQSPKKGAKSMKLQKYASSGAS